MSFIKKIPNSWVTPIRMIYTVMFNIYAWYWLYKIIFVDPFSWESIIEWSLACFGMWFFVLDSNDMKFKKIMNESKSYPDLTDGER